MICHRPSPQDSHSSAAISPSSRFHDYRYELPVVFNPLKAEGYALSIPEVLLEEAMEL